MASKTIITSDLSDSTEEAFTNQLMLNGKSIQVDLTPSEADTLVELLAPYFAVGRTASRFSAPAAPAKEKPAYDINELREFAAANGWDVPQRRPKGALIEAFLASKG